MLESKLTSEKVEKKGQVFYQRGKLFMLIGFYGFSLLALICVIALLAYDVEGLLLVLALRPYDYEFLIPIIVLCYIAIGLGDIGIFLYFRGIHFFALGRIAVNTEQSGASKQMSPANATETKINTPDSKANTKKKESLAPDQKKCWACGTVQKASNRFCINCNEDI